MEKLVYIWDLICMMVYNFSTLMCAVHDVRVEGSSPSWADIELSIS